jgi:kynurenine 3-monooxygenase
VLLKRYGPDDSFYINSVSRSGLNIRLIDRAAQHPNVSFHFMSPLLHADPATGDVTVQGFSSGMPVTHKGYDVIIGADGAGSALRASIAAHNPDFQGAATPLGHSYKELTIPAGPNGEFRMEKHALHIWPRGNFMLIALPNPDATFTCTLFLPDVGHNSFEELTSPAAVVAFFQRWFPDALPLITNLELEFFQNPTGYLATLRCWPWLLGHRGALVGDAAHAVVPFYGQGMNASFEDCVVLSDLHDNLGPYRWPEVLEAYQASRKPNADAIADLALQNFIEMRDLTADAVFQRKRKLELALEDRFRGDYKSKYQMVTFTETPYSEAKRLGDLQDEWLMHYCAQHPNVEHADLAEVLAAMRKTVR